MVTKNVNINWHCQHYGLDTAIEKVISNLAWKYHIYASTNIRGVADHNDKVKIKATLMFNMAIDSEPANT